MSEFGPQRQQARRCSRVSPPVGQGWGGSSHIIMRQRGGCDNRNALYLYIIPTMLRLSTSGFHRPGRYFGHQTQSAVGCSDQTTAGSEGRGRDSYILILFYNDAHRIWRCRLVSY